MKPYYEYDGITIYHGKAEDVLPTLQAVDLVLTDPPYGIGESNERNLSRGKLARPKDYGYFDWDKRPISQELYELCRDKGRYACIWGGIYYQNPPSPAWLVWDKQNGANDFADCELAWTNYGSAVRRKIHLWNGMIRKGQEERFHPTQKPLEIMEWAITLCPKVETVLDPFMGAGTTLLAAKNLQRRAIGIDRVEKYCEIAVKRLAQEVLPFAV